jgi:hypothetical protein
MCVMGLKMFIKNSETIKTESTQITGRENVVARFAYKYKMADLTPHEQLSNDSTGN